MVRQQRQEEFQLHAAFLFFEGRTPTPAKRDLHVLYIERYRFFPRNVFLSLNALRLGLSASSSCIRDALATVVNPYFLGRLH